MKGTTHTIRKALSGVAVIASAALIAIPAAQARNTLVDDYFRDAQPQNTLVDDYFRDAQPQSTIVDDYFRDASLAQPQSTLVDDYFRDARLAQPQNTLVDDYFRDAPASRASQVSSSDNIGWGTVGIGIGVAACGLLLLGALGIGARQLRHSGNRLGRA